MKKLTDKEQYDIQERINKSENIEAIYGMLHLFREWNRDWDTFMRTKPKSADDFVLLLSNQYTVEKRK